MRILEEFSTLCVVRADLSPLSGSAEAKQSKNGKSYWTIIFSIEIHFGLTEFKARIKWVDNVRRFRNYSEVSLLIFFTLGQYEVVRSVSKLSLPFSV